VSPAEKSKVRAAAWEGGVRMGWVVGVGLEEGIGVDVRFRRKRWRARSRRGSRAILRPGGALVFTFEQGEVIVTYVRVPVQLSQRSRLKRHDRRRNGFRHREIPRVDNFDGAAASCRLFRLDFASAEDVRAVAL
jgi:hypothetical protein